MSKPEQFISTTDFATLKNDATGAMSLNIPVGATWAGGSILTYETFLDIGTLNAPLRARMMSDRHGTNWAPMTSLQIQITVRYNTTGNPTFDDYFVANIERVSPTRLRLYVNLVYPGAPYTTTIVGGGQNIYAQVNTFLSPFVST